jgi:hypothetical protein
LDDPISPLTGAVFAPFFFLFFMALAISLFASISIQGKKKLPILKKIVCTVLT